MKCHVLLTACKDDLCKVIQHSFKDHYCQGARSNLLLVTFRTQPLYCLCRNFHVCFWWQNSLIASGSLVLKIKSRQYSIQTAVQTIKAMISAWASGNWRESKRCAMQCGLGILAPWSIDYWKPRVIMHTVMWGRQCNLKWKGMQPCRIICCI